MRLHFSLRTPGRRRWIVAPILAYILALQTFLAAWGAASAFAEAAGLAAPICGSHGSPHSSQPASDPPVCCNCGPLCLSSQAAAMAPAGAGVRIDRAVLVDPAWAPVQPTSSRCRAGASAQARAPPVRV